MEIESLTLTGLVAIGVVNVINIFKPGLDSRIKWIISAVAAFITAFIPQEIGNVILEKAKDAVMVAFAASGAYKLSQKIGGE